MGQIFSDSQNLNAVYGNFSWRYDLTFFLYVKNHLFNLFKLIAQIPGAVEYTNCIVAEE